MKIILQKVKSTEKGIRMLEAENVLIFETDRSVKKGEIKREVEGLFGVKVEKIRTQIRRNKKIAFVKLKPEHQAIDVATKLGMM